VKTDTMFTRPIRAEGTTRKRLPFARVDTRIGLFRAYQLRFLAHWREQHRRYRPPAAQPGCLGTRKTLRIDETSPVEDSQVE
jgi:hypothetical protein